MKFNTLLLTALIAACMVGMGFLTFNLSTALADATLPGNVDPAKAGEVSLDDCPFDIGLVRKADDSGWECATGMTHAERMDRLVAVLQLRGGERVTICDTATPACQAELELRWRETVAEMEARKPQPQALPLKTQCYANQILRRNDDNTAWVCADIPLAGHTHRSG